ncbi:hypothetical protein ACOMHN_028143 [Nucella lapillus]
MLTLTPAQPSSGQSSGNNSDEPLSPGEAAGISFGATLGCMIIATLAVMAVRAKRRRSQTGYRRLENPLLDPQGDYGSVQSRVQTRPVSAAGSSTAVNVPDPEV